MINVVVVAIIVVLVGSALAYIIKSGKNGIKCIGCPDCKSCSSCAACSHDMQAGISSKCSAKIEDSSAAENNTN